MDKVDEALERAEDIIIDCVDYFWNGDPHFLDSATESDQRLVVLAAEVRRLRAERDELRAALGNLVFTASKLWDDAKPIKDSAIIHATHPIIEQARAALSRTEGGEVRG